MPIHVQGLTRGPQRWPGVVCPLVTETGLWEHPVVCRAPHLIYEVQRGHTSPGWLNRETNTPFGVF